VFAHTEDGKNLLAGKDEAISEWHQPDAEDVTYIAMPEELAPYSEEDYGNAQA